MDIEISFQSKVALEIFFSSAVIVPKVRLTTFSSACFSVARLTPIRVRIQNRKNHAPKVR